MDSPDEEEVFTKYNDARKEFGKNRRLLTFNERIAQMGGDNGKFSKKLNTETHAETYFEEALESWRAEDLGPGLESFIMAIQPNEIKTYAQLLHKADFIFETLVEHITKEDSNSVPAFCGILSAFARDLREKFSKYCWKAFEAVFNILDLGARDADKLEAAYVCFSVLVKVQAGYLTKNIKKTFTNFLPLFASSRDFARRFAAESFAYILRKSSDLRGISNYIVKLAFKTPHRYLSDGCALLFYNSFVGIAGSFHSNCNQLFRDIVHSLVTSGADGSDEAEFNEFAIKILVQVMGYTIDYAKKSKYENRFFYQHVLTKMLGESKSILETTNLMRLLLPCVVEKNEEMMNEVNKRKKRKEKANKKNKGKNEIRKVEKLIFECPDELKTSLQNVVRLPDFSLNDHIVRFLSEILLTIFNDDKNRMFSRDLTLSIVEKSKDYDTAIELLLKLVQLESFDLYLMPALGRIAADVIKNKNDEQLKKVAGFYSYLCLQRRPIKETIDRDSRANFFDLSHHYSYREWILSNFSKFEQLDTGFLIDLVACWPWLYSQSETVKGVDQVLEILQKTLKKEEVSILNSQLVFACVSGLYTVQKKVLNQVEKGDIEEFLKRQTCADSSLLAFEMFIDVFGVSKDVEYMNRVVDLVFPALMSSNDDVRKTSLKILSNFKLPLPKIVDDEGKTKQQQKSVFDVLLEAESSELTNFRERLLHLRKLRFGDHREYIPVGSSDKVEKLIVIEMVSQFFVNFTPLWKGVYEILATFANEMNIDSFWDVMSQWISNVNKNIKSGATTSSDVGRLFGVDTINRTDFVNARIQLFEFFETIPNVAERRTRVLSPLVLSLYDDFIRLTSTTAQMEDFVTLSSSTEEIETEEAEDPEEDPEEVEELVPEAELSNRHEISCSLKALNALLNVFAKFNAAKATFQEAKLREMYEKLLTMKFEGLQRAALACIFSYRNSILAGYREKLEGLIDEKKLRQSLSNFKLSSDEDDAQVIDEHRSVVVPVLLRILHGKMMVNGIKKGAISRKNGIINVIGGCRSEELSFFLELYFSKIYNIFGKTATLAEIDEKCSKKSFMENVNLRVFGSVLQGVSEMLKKIARSMSDNEQKVVLHVTLACGIVSKWACRDTNSEHVKSFRMNVCDRLAEFFNAFPERQFYSEEIIALKDSILEAHIQDLPEISVIRRSDGILPVAPFAVSKLLANICRLPTFYQILMMNIEWKIRNEEEIRKCTCLDLLLAPLLWNGCFDLMFKTIRNGLLKLSELADEEMIQITEFVECTIVEKAKKTNLGTSLLTSRIRLVLDFLTAQIEKEVSTTKRPSAESIQLLERFCDFVTDFEDIPNRLATPLLMCIERRKCNEESMVNMMKAVARIAPILTDPKQYFPKLPRLFSKFEGRVLREALVEMVQGFAKSEHLDQKTRSVLHLLCELDAWDRSKVEEPHFERRYAAYQGLMKVWNDLEQKSDDPVDFVVLGMIVGSHFQLISTTSDLSLRMTAGNNVRALVTYSGRHLPLAEKRTFLDTYLSPIVVFYLKHDVDAVREEALSTLSVMTKSFKENQHLAELDAFSDDNDEDKDFLKSMNHIQIHRRQKAIRRMVEMIESGEKTISFNSMNKYLIPMINPYLVQFSAKFNAISDESLRLLKLIMSKAPWGKYCLYLETWLSKVEKANGTTSSDKEKEYSDKALVRIVVAVIEAFHFDMENEVENQEEDQKTMILQRINGTIMPRLTKCLDSQTHAIERNARTMETKATALHLDIQRAPIALAIVKLLQKLPEHMVGKHLHGVILKLCNLMMTHSFDVRETARKTLLQIIKCLGPKYLASVITEISLIMTKGFQVHVAIYSVHNLIVALKDEIKTGDLDSAVHVIVKMCIQDQFNLSEEKENGSIKAECPEAKGNRTPETMLHVGRIVSPAAIQTVLNPFREVVNEQPSAKAVQRVSELLSKFASGLKDNEGLEPTQLLTYIYKSLTADLKKLEDVEKKNSDSDWKGLGRRPESCLILPTAPKRIGAMAKVLIRSRDHVFAEFCVQLLGSLLKEKKLDITNDTMIARLNPFVVLVLDCFDFKYEKLISCSLRAICSMISMQLPAIKTNSQRVSDALFVLLSDYSSIGQAGNKPAIVQLNQLIYKGFTNLILTSGAEFLDNDKLTLLLAYAEADVIDQHKQATMFSLIKALVKKGVRHERMAEIMDHLSEIAIRSSFPNIRTQCRETLIDYIGGASDAEKRIEKHVEFFLDQLDYEYETGRLSAAEMLATMFKNLLAKTVEPVHMLCVVKMGAAMMNDESPKVVSQVGIALRNLLNCVGTAQRQETFEVICQWMETEDENARAVGLQVAVQLSSVEKEAMVGRVAEIMKRVEKCLFDEDVFEKNSEPTIILILTSLTRILANIGKSAISKFDATGFLSKLETICKCEESIGIMTSCSTLIGQILSFLDETTIDGALAKEICGWMSRCIRHDKMDVMAGEQASKNIVYLVKSIDLEGYKGVIGNIAAACRYEVKRQVKYTVKRMCCFKLIAALFVTGNQDRVAIVLDTFMPILVRELRAVNGDEELFKLTQEVCSLIKKKIGEEDYGSRVATCQKSASEKISERKRKIKELAVTAPDDAAELRRKKNKKKTVTRKRKIDEMKPYRLMKRRHAETRKAQENDED